MERFPVRRWFLTWAGLDKGGWRRWTTLVVAAVLVLLGQWLKAAGSLEGLETFAWDTVASFSQIQPFSFLPEFFYRLFGCYTYSGCDWSYAANPFRYPETLYTTFRDLLAGSSEFAGGVFVLSLGVGGVTLLTLWTRYMKRSGGDWHVGDMVGLCLLAPLATSIAALAMQVLAIVLFGLFGALIGLILFLLGTFGWVISAVAFLRQVRGTADSIDRVAGTVAAAADPPPPFDDPKA